jgi:proteasome accessory factor B
LFEKEFAVAEQPSLVRQWILLRTLCARRLGASVRELAKEMGVCDKTVRRDLESLREAGFPLEGVEEEHGRKKWRIETAKSQPELRFAIDEAVALYLGRRLMEPLAGTMFWDAAQRAFQKLRAMLGESALKHLERFAGMFHQTGAEAADYARKAELIDLLMIAIEDRRTALMTYRSQRAVEPATYNIHPYGLVYHRGSLYLVGYAPDHEEIRHWKVDRIEAIELTDAPFSRPEGFDLRKHLAGSFGVYHSQGEAQVRVRFSAEVARYVEEKRWHASQRLSPQRDGSVVAAFRLTGTQEIKHWVLGFGRHAVVLEPESLREEILEELQALADEYRGASQEHAN